MDCSICLECFDDEIIQRRPYLIDPCGHCLCLNCSESLNICPICRGNINKKIINRPLMDLISEKKSQLSQSKSNNSNDFDVFISFQWDLNDQVKSFHEKLNNQNNIKTYRNEIQYNNNNQPGLAEKTVQIIKSSKIFICFLTKKYIETVNSMKELTYAHSIGKRVLPIYIENIDIKDIHLLSFYENDKLICFHSNRNQMNNTNWVNQHFDSIMSKVDNNILVIFI
jgi:hypothetical protein